MVDGPDQGKLKWLPLSGSASLYHKINAMTFVIITAAHNFVLFDELQDGEKVPIFAKESYFYLQRDGGDSRVFEFKVM